MEAVEQAVFDDLPLKGCLMNPALDPLESPERRLANTILKNADVSPIKVPLHRELIGVRREFSRARDPAE